MIQLLLFQLICTESNLRDAWLKVKAKGSQGGIDGLGVNDFGKDEKHNLEALREELLESRYIPEPYKRINIPKFDGTDEKRPLGLPSVRDKIVQEAVRAVIEPLFEADFLNSSYAYRHGKSSYQAIRRVMDYVSQGYSWIACCDIERYFDTVNHAILLDLVRRKISDEAVLHLIKLWIKMGVVESCSGWRDTLCGISQGAVTSPLLANVYLHPLDKEMATCGYAYVRYADDFCLLSRDRSELERAVNLTKSFLRQQLKLTLGECEIASVTHGFSFLGVYYDGHSLDISEAKKSKHREELAYTFRTAKSTPWPQFVIKLNETIAGWQNYYGRLLDAPRLDYLRQLLVDNLAGLIQEKLKSHELHNYKDADSSLAGLVWGEGAENKKLVKDVLAQARKLGVVQTFRSAPAGTGKGRMQYAPTSDVSQAIAGKKRKYQRLQARECDLMVSTHGAFIGKSSRQVVVKCQGKLLQRIAEVNLKQIIIISAGVTISVEG